MEVIVDSFWGAGSPPSSIDGVLLMLVRSDSMFFCLLSLLDAVLDQESAIIDLEVEDRGFKIVFSAKVNRAMICDGEVFGAV